MIGDEPVILPAAGAHSTPGTFTLVIGPMGSAKTLRGIEEMRRYMMRPRYKTVALLGDPTPRFSDQMAIESRIGARLTASDVNCMMTWASAAAHFKHFGPSTVVLVDEAQFCDDLFGGVQDMLKTGCDVIVCGLDLSYLGKPFEAPLTNVLQLMELAPEKVVRCKAFCALCNSEHAIYTGKMTHSLSGSPTDPVVADIGAEEKYRALCRECWARRGECGFIQ